MFSATFVASVIVRKTKRPPLKLARLVQELVGDAARRRRSRSCRAGRRRRRSTTFGTQRSKSWRTSSYWCAPSMKRSSIGSSNSAASSWERPLTGVTRSSTPAAWTLRLPVGEGPVGVAVDGEDPDAVPRLRAEPEAGRRLAAPRADLDDRRRGPCSSCARSVERLALLVGEPAGERVEALAELGVRCHRGAPFYANRYQAFAQETPRPRRAGGRTRIGPRAGTHDDRLGDRVRARLGDAEVAEPLEAARAGRAPRHGRRRPPPPSPRRAARSPSRATGSLKRSAGGRQSAFAAPCGIPKRPPSAWAIACASPRPAPASAAPACIAPSSSSRAGDAVGAVLEHARKRARRSPPRRRAPPRRRPRFGPGRRAPRRSGRARSAPCRPSRSRGSESVSSGVVEDPGETRARRRRPSCAALLVADRRSDVVHSAPEYVVGTETTGSPVARGDRLRRVDRAAAADGDEPVVSRPPRVVAASTVSVGTCGRTPSKTCRRRRPRPGPARRRDERAAARSRAPRGAPGSSRGPSGRSRRASSGRRRGTPPRRG